MSLEKKYYVKSIKFNEEEFKKIQKMLIEENITFSKLIREKIFLSKKEQKLKNYQRLKLNHNLEMARMNYDKIQQIRAIGNNLNQIAKICNQKRTTDLMTIKKLNQIAEELRALRNDC